MLRELEHSDKWSNFEYCKSVKVNEIKGVICRISRGKVTQLDEISVEFERT